MPKRPRIAHSLAHSARLFGARKASGLALGFASVLALCSTCCGLGLIATPWFLCELLALQLGSARGAPLAHHRGYVAAGAVLLGAVLLTGSVAWLTWLGIGLDPAAAAGTAGLPHTAWLLVPASALAVVAFVLPFLYAPLILIERAPGFLPAVASSARLVLGGGALPHLALSVCANTVQVAPLMASSLIANAVFAPELGTLWALAALPLLSLTIPLGQGMVVSCYAEQPDVGHQREPRIAELRWVVIAFSLLWLAPLASFGLLGASLARPSRLASVASVEAAFARSASGEVGAGTSGAGEPVLELAPNRKPTEGIVRGTALRVRASGSSVRIEASDGGGAGKLPLLSRDPIERIVVLRRGDRYAILVAQGDLLSATVIDRAGVRLDDDLRARLFDRIDWPRLLWMLASLLLTAAVQLPLLSSLGQSPPASDAAGAAAAAPASSALTSSALSEPARPSRRALRVCLVCLGLLVPSLISLAFALQAALG